jgi:hypothetical protein
VSEPSRTPLPAARMAAVTLIVGIPGSSKAAMVTGNPVSGGSASRRYHPTDSGGRLGSRIPRVVLHVGIHKTGTTTLQVALAALRKQLRANGVALITIEQMKKLRHEPVWAARRTANRLEAPLFLEEFRSLVDSEIEAVERKSGEPVRQVLVTNERMVGARMPSEGDYPLFRPQTEAAIGEIIQALEPGEVHVAMYTRRQDRLIESCYLWEVQKGLSHSIREQFPFMDKAVMKYFELANRIANIPRIDSLRVRPFEIISGGSLAYLDDFLGNVGLDGKLDYSEFQDDPSANRSYSQKALDLATIVNPHLDTKEERDAVRRFLKRQFSTNAYPAAKILSDDERETLIALYTEDNERLFSTWMPELPYDAYSTVDGVSKLKSVLPKIETRRDAAAAGKPAS